MQVGRTALPSRDIPLAACVMLIEAAAVNQVPILALLASPGTCLVLPLWLQLNEGLFTRSRHGLVLINCAVLVSVSCWLSV